jgi:lipopolysaccharide heptosyltransferase I
MRVLIVKTSSMGDIIHTLPALTDAGRAIPGILFDWVVEEQFADIPRWHPFVDQVIPLALRRWRQHMTQYKTWQEWRAFRKRLRAVPYDVIIDAQGLLKSAFITLNAKGKRTGFNAQSAREPWAALFYQRTFFVAKKQHAISRLRQLFSQVLGYATPSTSLPDYGMGPIRNTAYGPRENYLVFLHGTTWETKHWPESAWIELVKIATDKGFSVKLVWGTLMEKERAERMAAVSSRVFVLPKQDLHGIAALLAGARAVVAVDTGLLHLTAALNVPAVSLYGPTDPTLSGALGKSQKQLAVQFSCAPCLKRKCIYPRQDSHDAKHKNSQRSTTPFIDQWTSHALNPFYTDQSASHALNPSYTDQSASHALNPSYTDQSASHALNPSYTDQSASHALNPPCTDQSASHPLNPPCTDQSASHALNPSYTDQSASHALNPSYTDQSASHALNPPCTDQPVSSLYPLNPPCTDRPVSSLYPPCFATLPPSLVWAELATLL